MQRPREGAKACTELETDCYVVQTFDAMNTYILYIQVYINVDTLDHFILR